MKVRVGFVGVATTHPFTDAGGLRAHPAVDLIGVVDNEFTHRAAEFSSRFGVAQLPTSQALLSAEPDLIIMTVRTAVVGDKLAALAQSGAPIFVNKVVAADPESVARLDRLSDTVRFGSASVLRFAPSVVDVARRLNGEPPDHIALRVGHDITGFLQTAWQDDPRDGGGTAVNVGIHAWEILDALYPGAVIVDGVGSCTRSNRTCSEESAAWRGSMAWQGKAFDLDLEVSGTASCYQFEAKTRSHHVSCTLDVSTEPKRSLGFNGLVGKLIGSAGTGSLVAPWSQVRTSVLNSVRAAMMMRVGHE